MAKKSYPYEVGKASVIITDFLRYSDKNTPKFLIKGAVDWIITNGYSYEIQSIMTTWENRNFNPYNQFKKLEKHLNITLGIRSIEVKSNANP